MELHPLLLCGAAICLITLLWAAYTTVRIIRDFGREFQLLKVPYATLFTAIAFWSLGGLLFRMSPFHSLNLTYIVASTGTILLIMALSFFTVSMRTGSEKGSWVHSMLVVSLALVGLILAIQFYSGGMITGEWTRPSGLVRYELSNAGQALFGLAFLVIFFSAIIYFVRSSVGTARKMIPTTALLLGLAAVVIPYKELALPQLCFQASFYFYFQLSLERSVAKP